MIDEISFFFDRSFKNIMMTFDNIEKSLARQTYFYTINYLFNYPYFKKNYNSVRSKYTESIRYWSNSCLINIFSWISWICKINEVLEQGFLNITVIFFFFFFFENLLRRVTIWVQIQLVFSSITCYYQAI